MATSELQSAIIDAYVRHFEQAFDPGRVASFYPRDGNKLTMVTNYFWNVVLCKELYLSLGAVEVAMRNAIHDTLTAHFNALNWYDEPSLLETRERKTIARVKREIRETKKPVIPGRVVAGATFGFWTGLLSTPYGTKIWSPNDAELIRKAFPFLPPDHQNRSYVHRRFNAIRALRNRVSHHEPIWRGVRLQSGNLVSLESLYREILEAIGWVSPDVRDSIVAIDRFPGAHRSGNKAIEEDLRTYLKLK